MYQCSHADHQANAQVTVKECDECMDKVARVDTGPCPTCDWQQPTEKTCVRCLVHLFRQPPRGMPDGWDHWQNTHDAQRVLLDHAAATVPEYPGGKRGRGIVIGAGGALYFAGAMIVLGVLRKSGCRLPVEFWYLDDYEMDQQMLEVAAAAGVRCVNAAEVAREHPMRTLAGFELKPYAMLHSEFEEVLYLDADNVPTQNPEYLFDDSEYLETGAIFWPDVPPATCNWVNKPGFEHEWLPEVCWKNVGLRYVSEPAFESGQMVIDKRRCWRPLSLTVFMCEQSQWYFRFCFGDKDLHHLAWRKLGFDYAMPGCGPGGGFPGLAQHDLNGDRLFQHLTQGKEMLAQGRRIDGLTNADLVLEVTADLKKRWSGSIWRWDDQTEEETRLARQVAGRYTYTRHLGRPESRTMRLEDSGWISEGQGGCERRWTLRLLRGVPTLVLVGTAHKNQEVGMMLLRQDEQGVWRGKWNYHEHCEVSLEACSAVMQSDGTSG